MLSLKKTKKIYQKPSAREASVDLEGIVCLSGNKLLNVDQLHNINADETASRNEVMYFEF